MIDIRILSWSATGFRCPDYNVSLKNGDSPYHVSLIQMPNGTGKTTTLSLLRAALSGQGEHWKPQDVAALKRDGDENSSGEFWVKLQFGHKEITFELIADFQTNKISYRTSVSNLGDNSEPESGMEMGHCPPRQLRPFLRSIYF